MGAPAAANSAGQCRGSASIVLGKPTIAVLAFDNLSGELEQAYFCDGIADDIITDLTKISGLAVIGRQSSFAYKGRPTDLRRVGRELGVRYVLEGSVRRSGSRLRVNAQLIEVAGGTHPWADRYDREPADAFLIGDEICEEIVTALDVKLSHGEEARVWRKAVKSPAARESFFRALDAYYRPSLSNMRVARQHFETIRLEPDSAHAHATAAMTHILEVMFGWSEDPRSSLAAAEQLTLRALELDDSLAGGYYAEGFLALFRGQHQKALEAAQGPSNQTDVPGRRAGLAYIELYAGKLGSAIRHAEEAIGAESDLSRLVSIFTAAAEYFAGRVEQALATLDRALTKYPDLVLAKVLRVAVLRELRASDEARANAKTILTLTGSVDGSPRIHPAVPASGPARALPFSSARRRFVRLLN